MDFINLNHGEMDSRLLDFNSLVGKEVLCIRQSCYIRGPTVVPRRQKSRTTTTWYRPYTVPSTTVSSMHEDKAVVAAGGGFVPRMMSQSCRAHVVVAGVVVGVVGVVLGHIPHVPNPPRIPPSPIVAPCQQ
jgi:hypothetical protein